MTVFWALSQSPPIKAPLAGRVSVQIDIPMFLRHLLWRANPYTMKLHTAASLIVSTRSATRERKYGFQNRLAFCVWQ